MNIRELRPVDELGRIVIPVDRRRTLGIRQRDKMEIPVEGERIVLTKHVPACSICGQPGELQKFERKFFYWHCMYEIGRLKTGDN